MSLSMPVSTLDLVTKFTCKGGKMNYNLFGSAVEFPGARSIKRAYVLLQSQDKGANRWLHSVDHKISHHTRVKHNLSISAVF